MANATPIRLHPLLTIQISVDIEPMVRELEKAIIRMPDGPLLYQRARQLVVIAEGVASPPWLRRPPDTPVIVEAQSAYLRQLASLAATFVKYSKTTKSSSPVLPPMFLVDTLRAQPGWKFPVLDGIVCAPTLCPNGSVLTEPGYHPESGLYVHLNGTSYPPLPDRRTRDEARTAIERLRAVFNDFPFVERWHFSATIAALLSLIARYAVTGNIPLFAVNANTAGTGKGLLIDTISTIATGRSAPCWPQTDDQEEERKRLLTIGLAGDALVHIDNITAPLGSGPLDSAITARSVIGRLLGSNEECRVQMDTVFFASGNNLSYKGDMVRRIIPIDMDPKTERPEERTDFEHSPLLPWVLEKRPQLVIDALTILVSYMETGQPLQGLSAMGSFDEWSSLIRSALIWAGEADPCEGRKITQAESDPDVELLQAILDAWVACYGTVPVTLHRVDHDIRLYTHGQGIDKWVNLRDALSALDPRGNGAQFNLKVIGKGLSARQGRRLGDKRLVRDRAQAGHNKTAAWKIEQFS
jgi:putative DNA primase/helicase